MKTNKNVLFTICSIFLFLNVGFGQNIGINVTGASPDPSALLDIDAATTPSLGILIPRISLQAINIASPVTSPATSLLVFNTVSASTGTNAVTPGYYFWDGTKWVRFQMANSGSSSTAWDLLGNAGTNASVNFLGTTDNQDLVFRTNNTEKMRVLANGNVGIGLNNPTASFHVNNTSYVILDRYNNANASHLLLRSAKGSIGSPTALALGDGLGMISFGGYDGTSMSLLNQPCLIKSDATENWTNSARGANLSFITTINGTTSTGTRMLIDHNGNVGIGTTTPSHHKLHVVSTATNDGIYVSAANNGGEITWHDNTHANITMVEPQILQLV